MKQVGLVTTIICLSTAAETRPGHFSASIPILGLYTSELVEASSVSPTVWIDCLLGGVHIVFLPCPGPATEARKLPSGVLTSDVTQPKPS